MSETLHNPGRCGARSRMRWASSGPANTPIVRVAYLKMLTVAFTLFSSVRVVAYLPTIWAICQTGDSSQHSLWTWITWAGANVTMAAWLYEQDGQRMNRAIAVNLCNAAMCLGTTALIVFHRW